MTSLVNLQNIRIFLASIDSKDIFSLNPKEWRRLQIKAEYLLYKNGNDSFFEWNLSLQINICHLFPSKRVFFTLESSPDLYLMYFMKMKC